MKNLNPTITKIDAQIAQLTTSLQQSAQSPRPQWLQGSRATQQRMLNQAVGKIIATHLAQDPKLPVANLPPTEQKALFRALAQYTKLITTQVLQTLKPAASTSNEEANKKEALNKKITAAKKLLAALMLAVYESHSQYYRKKLRKKLQRLATLEKKKEQAEMLAVLAWQEQKSEPGPLLLPTPKPMLIPTPTPKETPDYKLSESLQLLGLELGADHKAIDAAFNKLSEEFSAKPNHSPEEQAQFDLVQKAYNTLMAVSAERLAELPKITGQEIEEFAAAFKAQMPDMLSEDKTVTLEALKAAFIEGGIHKSAEGEPADTSDQMLKMQLTMAKLEKQFNADPRQLINLSKEFLNPQAQAQSQSRLAQTPTFRPPTGF